MEESISNVNDNIDPGDERKGINMSSQNLDELLRGVDYTKLYEEPSIFILLSRLICSCSFSLANLSAWDYSKVALFNL